MFTVLLLAQKLNNNKNPLFVFLQHAVLPEEILQLGSSGAPNDQLKN